MSSLAERLQRKSQKASATKQVRLKLVYVDFWSAVKLSFLIALTLGIILVVATVLVWVLLNALQVFSAIDGLMSNILNQKFSVTTLLPLTQVALFAVVVGLLNTVVGTVLGAIAAMLYNFSVRITGGLLVGFTNN
ncbi:DUF3566 domain-containing protein [Glaciihabitans sp. UYNi722]|uniref:DUF3566 domain-containing protein n=1 Tax=Glaciihabitans sp. UYNi722 TaxID=3156344 RepID=UPI003390F170